MPMTRRAFVRGLGIRVSPRSASAPVYHSSGYPGWVVAGGLCGSRWLARCSSSAGNCSACWAHVATSASSTSSATGFSTPAWRSLPSQPDSAWPRCWAAGPERGHPALLFVIRSGRHLARVGDHGRCASERQRDLRHFPRRPGQSPAHRSHARQAPRVDVQELRRVGNNLVAAKSTAVEGLIGTNRRPLGACTVCRPALTRARRRHST